MFIHRCDVGHEGGTFHLTLHPLVACPVQRRACVCSVPFRYTPFEIVNEEAADHCGEEEDRAKDGGDAPEQAGFEHKLHSR